MNVRLPEWLVAPHSHTSHASHASQGISVFVLASLAGHRSITAIQK